MSELIILIIVLLISFVGLAWYARYRSQQRSKSFEIDTISNRDSDAVSDEFGAILQQEITRPADNVDELDLEPEISLSTGAQALTQGNADATSQAPRSIQSQPPEFETETKPIIKSTQDEWDLMLVLSVMAKQNQSFNGLDIKRVFDELALTYGAMKIYNKKLANNKSQVLFSVANMMAPGTLDPDALATLQTKGLVFFITLPNPINGLTLFDEMLDTATKTADRLGGELCDDQHLPLTDNYLERIRSKILNFNLTLQMEQNQS